MFTGVKNNINTVGVDESVRSDDCETSLDGGTHLTSLAALAQAAGKATGIVTTTRVTHATPAAMYAHSAHRNWECDSALPAHASKCKDIARQLIEDLPGKNFNVIMGGGQYMMQANITSAAEYMDSFCLREDGRDLIAEWEEDKKSLRARYAIVNDTKSLLSVVPSKTDYILGIFSKNHMVLDCERDKSEHGTPSLEDMTTTAIKVLMNNKKGFLLMVESGLIDIAHHLGKARKAIHEVLTLNDAVNSTIHLLESTGLLEETLVVVTSDHSHTLSISGYPKRGNNIFGIAGLAKDRLPYTTLGYANSGAANYHYKVVDNKVVRDDPSKDDTNSFEYGVQASVLQDINTHGGNDVFIYAKGPYAHLFHHMHEQNYLAAAVKYAAKLGEFTNHIHTK